MARQKRIKLSWMFGAIGLAIGLLILGRLGSDTLRENSTQSTIVDTTTLPTNEITAQQIELTTSEDKPVETVDIELES